MLMTIPWMFVGTSQSGMVQYTYLIFPIPIVILFTSIRAQLVLITLSYVSFLICHFIILRYPAPLDSYSSPSFSLVLVGVWMCLSFIMLLFFVSEMDQSEQRLQQKNIELEEFSRIASHDMKQPLRTISSFSSLIRKKHKEEISVEVSSYLDYIESGIGRLDKLLDDLSSYSTIDSNEESLEDVDLNIILLNVMDDLKQVIAETNTNIISNQLPTIKVSKSQISQVFQNLIHNAIKFQPLEKSRIPELRIESRLIKGFHHLTFQDNGIGIKEEFLDQIFIKFKRLHSRDKYEGTGLGLATCKRIVEKYNGTIGIQSKLGEGTIITIKFMAT